MSLAQRLVRARRAIAAERQRQIESEGWTPEHDDAHENGEMLSAAVLYYANAKQQPGDPPMTLKADGSPVGWPWEARWWKPKTRQRDLERAGALCLAEKDRLRRAKHSWLGHVDQKLGLITKALTEISV
jgi:hypothetical protein